MRCIHSLYVLGGWFGGGGLDALSSHYGSHHVPINTKLFSIVCIGPTIWNRLPNALKELRSLGSFKHLLKESLIASSLIG